MDNSLIISPTMNSNSGKKMSILDSIKPVSIDLQPNENSTIKAAPSNYVSPLKHSGKAIGIDDVPNGSKAAVTEKLNERQLIDFASKELDDFLRQDFK